jgi:hypothetical protein
VITGSCLCGGIKYEVEEMPGRIYNCHCSQCRKSHGAAFATQALAIGKTLRILEGEELLKEYTGHGGVRAFCSNCGSRLMNYAPDKSLYFSIALSSVDSDHALKPVAHAFIDSKASWHEPSNDIPSYPGLPDGALE